MSNTLIQLEDNYGNKLFPLTPATSSFFTDVECKNAFIGAMNKKAASLGMSNTTWINPSGLGERGNYSKTSVRDLTRMMIEALSYNRLLKIWNKPKYSVRVKNKSNINITTSVTSPSLENYYPILGGKTGGGDGYLALVIATIVENVPVVGAIAEVSTRNPTDRFVAMKQLFDAVKVKIQGGTPSQSAVTIANCACAYLVPNYNTATVEDSNLLSCLYEQNADKVTTPMSTTKVMTVITALDYIYDIHVPVMIKPLDVESTQGTSGSIFSVGDIVSLEDLMYAAMLPSSNQAANAIARYAGQKILAEYNFIHI